ncbi:hypothetical protein EV122DRAFT_248888 [Schizophyllum commune]
MALNMLPVKITSPLHGVDYEHFTPPPSVKPLHEFHYIVKRIVPEGVDLRKKGPHRYRQAPPTYLLGYFVQPSKLYDARKRSGLQEATVEATLNKYLALVKENTGLTWGDGILKEFINGEEWWLFYGVQSSRKEDIQAIGEKGRNGLRRALGFADDPMLIIYCHPRRYIS